MLTVLRFILGLLFFVLVFLLTFETRRRNKEDSEYWLELWDKEQNNEPLTPREMAILHPDESWRRKYPGYPF